MFAGVLALAAQLNNGNVGPINRVLYDLLGKRGADAGIADVVSGNNTVTTSAGKLIPGLSAAPGFDVASGWGTIDAARFVPSLVAGVREQHENRAARRQAQADLNRLENGIRLVGSGHSVSLSETGLLPGHPVDLTIDHHPVATLTVSKSGTVSHVIDPSALRLPRGRHVITLTSMLLTATAEFSTR